MWIARDKNSKLYAWNIKPMREKDSFVLNPKGNWTMKDLPFCILLRPHDFPEVTWENSPVEIKGFALTKGLDLKNKI